MASLTRISTTINVGDTIEAATLESSEGEYDVFLNFRGEDTRRNIADHLYLSLKEAQIKVFMDESSLPYGKKIERKLLDAIERSQIAITIISEDYASSAYCLKELAHILNCMETGRLMVMPIFYKVNPSDIRRLRNSFERIQMHIINYDRTIVQSWKNALVRIGHMKGLAVDGTSYQGRIVRSIVQNVRLQLINPRKMNFNPRPERKRDSNCLVGMDEHAREIIEAISKESNGVQTVGICGMGGIGKTTLARYIYNQLKHSFEFCSFVTSFRHTFSGEVSVDQIISLILEHGLSITNSSNKDMDRIEQFFYNKKVFIVLDDIDSGIETSILMRMNTYFSSGSIVMFTTRNVDVPIYSNETCYYELPPLEPYQSLRLFCHHAFGRFSPPDWTVDYARRVVPMIGGLPLLLEVIGSSLLGKKMVQWKNTSIKLAKIPSDCVLQKLLVCYKALEDNEKQLFLDVSFFPNGFDKQSLFFVLDTADKKSLDTLETMSLVKFDNDNKLYMHDLLRDLGGEILRDKSTKYHNGLWNNESRQMLKRSKLLEFFKSTPLTVEVDMSPIQLDEQSYFSEVQTERKRTITTAKGKEPVVALEKPWMSQHKFDESSKVSELQSVTPKLPLQFSGKTGNTSMTGCNGMEAESMSQSIAQLNSLFGEINFMLAYPQYTMEEKLSNSTHEAISLVDSFIKEIDFPNVADIDFRSPSFLQALESLRQPNALLEVPMELLMPFHEALTSFAETPKHLNKIQSAKGTFDNCTQVYMAKVDEIQNLKFVLDLDKEALVKTESEIVLLEAKLTSLKAKKGDLETKLTNAIPTVTALSDELRRCRPQLLEAQAHFDEIPTSEGRIKTNHHQILHLLHKIKNVLRRKARN